MLEKQKKFTERVNCLIKIIAIVLIASGFVFSGCCISSFQHKKAVILGEIVMIITFMQSRLHYECLPLAALLCALEENGKTVNLKFISLCREKTENGNSFSSAWRESIESDNELCRLMRSSVSYLIRLGEDLGTTDLEGQLSCLAYYESIFRNELNDREELNKKYSKLYPVLGTMLGIWAAILII